MRKMRTLVIRLLAIQALAGLAIAAGFFVRAGLPAALAAGYGTGVALVTLLLLAWRVIRAARPGAGMAGLYLSAAERMVLVIVGFAGGIAWLGLEPIAMLIGFAGAQIAYFLAAGPLRRNMLDTLGSASNGK